MTGFGMSHGALTVVNAVSCGKGAAFGINLCTKSQAEIKKRHGFYLEINGVMSSPLFAELLIHQIDSDIKGAYVKTESEIPMSMGLKSSSAAANAILTACADALGIELSSDEILNKNADASIKAGVSITGAFDDSAACLLGGLVFTDNFGRRIIDRRPMPEGLRAVIILPGYTISKSDFPISRLKDMKDEAEVIFHNAYCGDVFKSMYDNGSCTCRALGISNDISDFCIAHGAKTAGVSGTGPAVGVLTDSDKVDALLKNFEDERYIITDIWNGI